MIADEIVEAAYDAWLDRQGMWLRFGGKRHAKQHLIKTIHAYLAVAKPYEAGQLAMRERAASLIDFGAAALERDDDQFGTPTFGDKAQARAERALANRIRVLAPEEPRDED